MCSQFWTPLPPPSPYHPSGSSQCTGPKRSVSCIKPGLVICFLYDIIHVSVSFHLIPSSVYTHWWTFPHFPHLPAPGNYHFTHSFCEFVFFDSIYKWDHTISVFLYLTFHLAQWPQGSSVLLQNAEFPSFSWLDNIQLCSVYTVDLWTIRNIIVLGYQAWQPTPVFLPRESHGL